MYSLIYIHSYFIAKQSRLV